MAKIRTTVPVLFDSRHDYHSVMEIEITKFQETASGVIATVTDYYFKDVEITNDQQEIEIIQQRLSFRTSDIPIGAEQMDAIALAVQSQMPPEATESQRREAIKQVALLYFVQNDRLKSNPDKCVYITDPNQWEIVY